MSLICVLPINVNVWNTIIAYFRNTYNPGQNIWHKVKKSSRTGRDSRTLLSNFACFLTAIVKV